MLEFWFPFSDIEFTRRLRTWCDGVALLKVSLVNRTTFLVIGVGFFPDQLSPFELCFRFPHRRSLHPNVIELRFGILDGDRKLLEYSPNEDPEVILSERPTTLDQWAVAVELS